MGYLTIQSQVEKKDYHIYEGKFEVNDEIRCASAGGLPGVPTAFLVGT